MVFFFFPFPFLIGLEFIMYFFCPCVTIVICLLGVAPQGQRM